MNNASQNAAILRHMETVGPIDTMTAIHEYGCTRLASRISDLKKMGFEIADEGSTTRSRANAGKRTAYAGGRDEQ